LPLICDEWNKLRERRQEKINALRVK